MYFVSLCRLVYIPSLLHVCTLYMYVCLVFLLSTALKPLALETVAAYSRQQPLASGSRHELIANGGPRHNIASPIQPQRGMHLSVV